MTAIDEKCMKTPNENIDPMTRIDPPSASRGSIRKPVQLVIQLIYFLIIFLPLLVWSGIENLFFTERKSVRGKVVLVTGSGRGLGQGFVEKFAELGCKVACVDVDEKLNDETVNVINEKYPGCAKSYKCNVASSKDIKELKEAVSRDFGDVNILVHNAGLIAGTPITKFDDIYVHGVIAVNLTSHFLMIREFVPDMVKRNEGHVVAVASVAGFSGITNASMYVATKHGVVGLMECLHYELNEIPNNKVQTTVICPYFINTSAFYMKYWHLRVPAMSIRATVEAAVDAILKNKRVATIPSLFYHCIHISKLLPDKLNDILRNIFYVKITVPSQTIQQSTPVYKLLLEASRDIELTMKNA